MQPQHDFNFESNVVLVKHAVFAAAGGLVRSITADGKHTLLRVLAGGLIGMFTGMITFCFCRHLQLSDYLTGAFTGLGGYMGTPLLDWLGKKLKQKL